MNFNNIPQSPHACYSVHVPWIQLNSHLDSLKKDYDLNLDPPFQRAHVWTIDQKERYIEWMLSGGFSGQNVFFNCPGWLNVSTGNLVLVDGKQRIDAVLGFLNNEVKAFGFKYNEFDGRLSAVKPFFIFNVNNLETEKEVLKWYIAINTGGTPHKKEEIEKVRMMLNKWEG